MGLWHEIIVKFRILEHEARMLRFGEEKMCRAQGLWIVHAGSAEKVAHVLPKLCEQGAQG